MLAPAQIARFSGRVQGVVVQMRMETSFSSLRGNLTMTEGSVSSE